MTSSLTPALSPRRGGNIRRVLKISSAGLVGRSIESPKADTEAPYYDTRPLAQPGVPEVREYKVRGMVADDEIGQSSDIVSLTFAG